MLVCLNLHCRMLGLHEYHMIDHMEGPCLAQLANAQLTVCDLVVILLNHFIFYTDAVLAFV